MSPYKVVVLDRGRTGTAPAYSLEEALALFAKLIEIAPGNPIALCKGETVIKEHLP